MKLNRELKLAKSSLGINKHVIHTTIIKSDIVEQHNITPETTLYYTIHDNYIRLTTYYRAKSKGTIIPKMRKTKTTKDKKYYSTKITIPAKVIQDLNWNDITEINQDSRANHIDLVPA